MDIVERLRKNCTCNFESTPCGAEEECQNAFDGADEIVRLQTQLKFFQDDAMGDVKTIDHLSKMALANSDLQMWFDYAKTECDKLQAEVLKLRGSLAFISMLTPLDGQSWESHAKFITAYALYQLEEIA